ncbi:MAG: DUF3443 family protein [Terriglobia bacterium]
MRSKNVSPATLACLLSIIAGGTLLSGCTVSRTGNDVSLPVITLSPTTATVPAGQSVQFTATVVSPIATYTHWAVNNIVGGNSTVGTVSSTGLYRAPASIPSPATVTVKCISQTESYPYGSAIVTITSAASPTVAVSPVDSSAATGGTVKFTANVTGIANTAVTWYVNGVAGGSSAVGSITSAGAYTAPASVPNPPTVVVTATSQADTSESASTTLTITASNTAPLYVSFGINGDTGVPSTDYYNGLFTSVTICLPGTADCQTIPDILVDTGSVGLRVLNSALTAIPATELTTVLDSHQNQVQECVQFGDASYAWGPVLVADLVIGGEKAPYVPMQVLGDTVYTVPASSCLPLGQGVDLDTVAALGANGILGVGIYSQDCGLDCAAGQLFTPYPYYVCPEQTCQTTPLPVTQQVTNPVALFAHDNNGVEIVLPSISATGAPSLPYTRTDGSSMITAGSLIFGVGTESNNGIGNATIYATDANGNFPTIGYNSTTYTSEGILDTGSKALYVLDAQTLGAPVCFDSPYYCPSSPLSLVLTLNGANGSQGTATLNIDNADTLFSTSPGYAAFNDLGGPSGDGLSTDYFDLGVPFFFGRSVFVGIAGTAVPNNASAPNGYFAF